MQHPIFSLTFHVSTCVGSFKISAIELNFFNSQNFKHRKWLNHLGEWDMLIFANSYLLI